MSPQRPEFRADLEGLRGVAILLVVLFHAGVTHVAGGFVGVDVFFVMSGFFITGLLARETSETGGINLTEFYAKRALRLLPPLLVVLMVTLIGVMVLYAPIDRAAIAGNARAVAMYSGNMAFAKESVDYFSAGENPLLHTWSLAVEQQFYFFWPMLFVLIALAFDRRTSPTAYAVPATRVVSHKPLLIAIGLTGTVSFAISMILTGTAQSWAFFSMPTRVWEFAMGGALALWMQRSVAISIESNLFGKRRNITALCFIALQLAGLLAIALAAFMYDRSTPYPGIAALLPALATLALLFGGAFPFPSAITRSLSTPVLRWLGTISYGWYLWHWPLIGLAGVLNPTIDVSGKLVWCAVALVLAWLTYRFVEIPARSGKLSRYSAQRIAVGTFAATVMAALLAHGALMVAERTTSDPAQQAFASARANRVDHGCWGTTVEEIKQPCEFGDTKSSTTVVLFGDSHAEHWFGAIDRVGRERGWKIVLMVKGGCPVADMPALMRRQRYYHECTRFREAMMQRILALKPAAAILSSWDHYLPVNAEESPWQVTPEMWESGLRRTYSRLSAAGIPVVAIRGTPRTGFRVPQCLSRREAGLMFSRTCEYDLASSLIPEAVAAQNSAARGLGVRFVDMNDQVCWSKPCQVMRAGVVVFTDDNHLTVTFSRSVSGVFGQRVADAARLLGRTLP
ncbi:MAG: acyltransferase family protein [Gemmatimonadaceae bacterium]